MIEYGLILVAGFLASLHCIGMCGMMVLAYSVSSRPAGPAFASQLALHFGFNAGRVLSYAALGALVGAVGLTLSWSGQFSDYVALACGFLMVLGGLAMLDILPIPSRLAAAGSRSFFYRLHARLIGQTTFQSKLLLGALTPLLPCGVLYAMLAKAAAAEGIWAGALTMGLFGLGMTPALMALGSFSSFFSSKVRKGAERLAAVTIILLGIILLLRGWHIPFLSFLPTGGGQHPSCCSSAAPME